MRITGDFDWVRTRTAARQAKPYPPLREATRGEPVIQFDDVSGIVAGFRTPLYEQGIGVPGGHVHFIDDDRAARRPRAGLRDPRGGALELCLGTDLHLALPLTSARSAERTCRRTTWPSRSRQTENHR